MFSLKVKLSAIVYLPFISLRYLKSRDSASLYMKEYRESNKSAIRDGQK